MQDYFLRKMSRYPIDQLAQMGYTVCMSGSLLAMEEKIFRFAVDRRRGQPANSIGHLWTFLY
jgi:hypothetical protein